MEANHMKSKYHTTENGMEYILYKEPIEMNRMEILTRYSDGGFILFKKGKNIADIKVYAYARFIEGWAEEDFYHAFKQMKQIKKISEYRRQLIFPESFSSKMDEIRFEKDENDDKEGEELKPVRSVVEDIREWLDSESFKSFSTAITNRVIGQEQAELVAINVYNYLECIARGVKHNNNILMAAPSGCGKTETYRAIREYFARKIPQLDILQIDMSTITEQGYKGKNPDDIFTLLRHNSDEGVAIVFLDEFDKKLLPSIASGGINVNMAVQSQILTLIEGRKEHNIDTGKTLFIGMGAFEACRTRKEEAGKHMGFGNENDASVSHYADISRQDMIDIGAAYELIGRFSMIVNYHELANEAVDRIIDMTVNRVSNSIKCEILLSEEMRCELHDNANSRYGCRLIESIIRENAMRGYLMIQTAGDDPRKCSIVIDSASNVRYEHENYIE